MLFRVSIGGLRFNFVLDVQSFLPPIHYLYDMKMEIFDCIAEIVRTPEEISLIATTEETYVEIRTSLWNADIYKFG